MMGQQNTTDMAGLSDTVSLDHLRSINLQPVQSTPIDDVLFRAGAYRPGGVGPDVSRVNPSSRPMRPKTDQFLMQQLSVIIK